MMNPEKRPGYIVLAQSSLKLCSEMGTLLNRWLILGWELVGEG